jgi:hypothetical protein
MRRAGFAVLGAVLACATAGERAPQAPPPSFRAVRSLVLVRRADDRGSRPKDALDGLDESLRARGYTTRVVEVGGQGKSELARLHDLFDRLELRAGSPRGGSFGAGPTGDAGASAGEVVAELGVDAVASYHRLEGRRFAPPPPPAPVFPGTYSTQTQAPTPWSAQGAFVIVDRSGRLAVFPWGESGQPGEPESAINAAEAIDQVVRGLTGEAAEPE